MGSCRWYSIHGWDSNPVEPILFDSFCRPAPHQVCLFFGAHCKCRIHTRAPQYFSNLFCRSWCESPVIWASCNMDGRCSQIPSQNAGLDRKSFGHQDQFASTRNTIYSNNNIIPCHSKSMPQHFRLRTAWHHASVLQPSLTASQQGTLPSCDTIIN